MTRVKRGTIAAKRRRNTLKRAKGYKWGRKSKYRAAKLALMKAGTYAYRDRRNKKRDKRALWQAQINAACRKKGVSYSKFIGQLKKAKIEIDRKIMASLAIKHPEIFEQIIQKTKAD